MRASDYELVLIRGAGELYRQYRLKRKPKDRWSFKALVY